MRSRGAKLSVAAVAWIAGGVSLFFVIQSERHLAADTSVVRTFDMLARQAGNALADLRASEEAYVATGQGEQSWQPKVAAALESVSRTITSLRTTAQSLGARAALDEAGDAVEQFTKVDKRVRDYIRAGDT